MWERDRKASEVTARGMDSIAGPLMVMVGGGF